MTTENINLNDRKNKDKDILLEQLRKTPIVLVCCEKTGTSRTTYYRWRKEDASFAKKSDEALREGTLLINDFAESQLITAIKNNNLTAIIYWLNHRHESYGNKLEVRGKINTENTKLTPEQEKSIIESLNLTTFFQNSSDIKPAIAEENKNINNNSSNI